MNEQTATDIDTAEEWAAEAHAMMAEGMRPPMNTEKVRAASALLRRATALREGTTP